jgi:competence protein ComEC
MRLAAPGFALGVWLLQQQPALPGCGWLLAVAAAACAALAAARFSRRFMAAALLAVVAFAALGFSWAAALAQLRLSDRLDAALEGRDVEVTGVVASLPQNSGRAQRFDFDVESPAGGVPRHISLSLYEAPAPGEAFRVHPGERWRFTVRLRRPHGAANPHGFD